MGFGSHSEDGPVDSLVFLFSFVNHVNKGPFRTEVSLWIWADDGVKGVVRVEALVEASIVIQLVVISLIRRAYLCSKLTGAVDVVAFEDELIPFHNWEAVKSHLAG